MNSYTSGRISHDPAPVVYITKTGRRGGRTGIIDLPKLFPNMYAREPRPEFDNHNPILVAYRAHPEFDLWDMGFAMFATYGGERTWEKPDHYFHAFTVATPEHVEHARRVLSLLASIGGAS